MKTLHENYVVSQLLAHMWECRRRGISFGDCMAAARAQFQREVRQETDRKPLPQAR